MAVLPIVKFFIFQIEMKVKITLLILFCDFSHPTSSFSSVMDLSELSSVHYNMKIDKNPVVEMEEKVIFSSCI